MDEEITIIEANNPFEAREKIHRLEVNALNREIIRLKIRCGEEFTNDELIDGFGRQAHCFRIVKPKVPA